MSSFSGERHGAMERHSSSGWMHGSPGGDRGVVAMATRGHPAHQHSVEIKGTDMETDVR